MKPYNKPLSLQAVIAQALLSNKERIMIPRTEGTMQVSSTESVPEKALTLGLTDGLHNMFAADEQHRFNAIVERAEALQHTAYRNDRQEPNARFSRPSKVNRTADKCKEAGHIWRPVRTIGAGFDTRKQRKAMYAEFRCVRCGQPDVLKTRVAGSSSLRRSLVALRFADLEARVNALVGQVFNADGGLAGTTCDCLIIDDPLKPGRIIDAKAEVANESNRYVNMYMGFDMVREDAKADVLDKDAL